MKKTSLTLLAAVALMVSSCMTTGLGTTTSTTSSNNNVWTNVLGAVLGQVLLGGMTFDQSSLLGNWNYNAPSAAFTTQQALTKAGGTAPLTTCHRRWQVITTASVSIVTTLLSHYFLLLLLLSFSFLLSF